MSEIRVTNIIGENGSNPVGLSTGFTVGPTSGTTGIGATITHQGHAQFAGVCTATSFSGSGASLTGLTAGITEYDIYRLAANYTVPASNTTITQSMVRPLLFFEKIGSGMSVSSGIFTFPSTGKYEIQAFFQGFQSNGNDNIFKFNMDATHNNSSYQEVVNCREGNYDSGRAFSATFTYLIDITNTSTHKVRFGTTTAGSNRVQLDGNSASNILDGTYFVFKKVGDT